MHSLQLERNPMTYRSYVELYDPIKECTHIPECIRYDPNYLGYRDLILQTNRYDYLLTLECHQRHSDQKFVKSVNHFMNVINRKIFKRGPCRRSHFNGYAFLERHVKSLQLEGCLHAHMLLHYPLGYTPEWDCGTLRLKAALFAEDKVWSNFNTYVDDQGIRQYVKTPMFALVDIRRIHPGKIKGAVNYLSKQLTPDNLRNRLFPLKNGKIFDWEQEPRY